MNRVACFRAIAPLIVFLATAETSPAEDFRYSAMRVERNASSGEAMDLLKQRAVERAVEDLMGAMTGENADEVLERRLLLAAKAKVDQLVTVTVRKGPHENEIQGWWVEGDVVVSRSKLEALKTQIATNAEQLQLKVLVAISETVEYTNWPWGPIPAEKKETGSMIARQLEAQLLDFGYEVVDADQIDFLRTKAADFSKLEGDDLKQTMAIMKNQGCDLLIVGHATVTGPRVNVTAVPGRTLYFWQATPNVSVVAQDTGRKISVPIPGNACGESGGTYDGPVEARKALAKVGDCIADKIVDDLRKRLPKSGEPREVVIQIIGINASQAGLLNKQLQTIPTLSAVKPRFSHGTIELRVKTPDETFSLATAICGLDFDGKFTLTAEETGPNSISIRVSNQ